MAIFVLEKGILIGEYPILLQLSPSPDEREVQFRFDSDDQGKIWLNGTEVFTHTKTHSAEIDRYVIPITLKQGKNSILVKVCQEEGSWGFYLRITAQNGKSIDDLVINRAIQNKE